MTFRLAPTRTAVHRIAGEERLFGTALALIALQLATVATVNHALEDVRLTLVVTGLAPAMFVAFRHGGRMVRIVLAAPLGLAAAAAGLARHAARIAAGTPEPVDYTGALLGLAGIA